MKARKRASDALLVLAVVLLVVAVAGPSWAYPVAGACLVGAVVCTVARRRLRKALRPQT